MITNTGQHNEFALVLQFVIIFVYCIHIIIKTLAILSTYGKFLKETI